jgi:predicted ArsR family transcriptional regulator
MNDAAPDLFAFAERYPQAPGWKARDTARSAADAAAPRAPLLRERCLAELQSFGPLTADEIARRLKVDRLSIRPRLSELSAIGKVKDSGLRRPNDSGKSAIAWEAAQ